MHLLHDYVAKQLAGVTFQARLVMESIIDNLARALRKLATGGSEHAVLTADHGHLFLRCGSRRVDAHGRTDGQDGRPPPAMRDR